MLQLFDQQGNIPFAQVPIVLLDMWEHAFYLQYQNVKADYVTRLVERRQLGRRDRAFRAAPAAPPRA